MALLNAFNANMPMAALGNINDASTQGNVDSHTV
jgi:hypothetical protein